MKKFFQDEDNQFVMILVVILAIGSAFGVFLAI